MFELPDWLENFLHSNANSQQGTTSTRCGNLDPDNELECNKFEEHTGPCAYTGFEMVTQWQIEDSANY